MTHGFIESAPLEVRRRAVEAVLNATEVAVNLLILQVEDESLPPKERRAAAALLLTYAGLNSGVPAAAQGPPRAPGVDILLGILNAKNQDIEDMPNPFV